MEFADEGGEGPTPYEVLLHAAMMGDSTRFTRQDGVEETWRVFQPLLDSPPPVHPYEKGSWGPAAADAAGRRPRRLARALDGVMSTLRGVPLPSAAGTLAVPADRRLRVPLELPHGRPGRARRGDRLAVRPALRLAERVRHPARPRGRRLPARAVRHQRPHGPRSTSPARTSSSPPGTRPTGWVDGPRRPDDGPAPGRGHRHAAHAAAGRRRRRPRAGAHGRLPRRARSSSSCVCEPVFDYGRDTANWSIGRRPPHRRRDRGRVRRSACTRTWRGHRGRPRCAPGTR